jgi:glucose/arabinose dehydrogenase
MPRYALLLSIGVMAATVCAAQEENDGLSLPAGFRASVFHEGVGPARHIAIRPNGDVYVATRQPAFGPSDPSKKIGIVALRDADGDGKAEIVEHFSDVEGTGMEFYNGMLYASNDVTVYRFHFKGDELVPEGAPEVVVQGFAQERQHADKPFTFDGRGSLYVNVGAPSNSCQAQERSPGSKGREPCPLLERYGGIWRFDAEKLNQSQEADGKRYASGLRNSVALQWNKDADALFVVVHGRDQLDTLWPSLYNAKDNAERTAEEMHLIRDGGEYGWPYTFFDVQRGERMLAPEYGGDGKTPAPAGKYPDPVVAFPAHWAPNDLVFYAGEMFPAAYRGGAFVAFHGSWNRAPEPQGGYKVAFVPFKDGKPAGEWQVFADNFTRGELKDNSPFNAAHRPVGLAVAPDGSLFVTDSMKGRIWRIAYTGS